MNAQQFSEQFLIYKCIAGSRLYGTSTPTSDVDTRGCFVAPPSSILSCNASIEQVEDNKQDEVCYELRKFMKLAAQCNPNIIELLFIEDKDILFIDWPFQKLRDNKHLFLSKKAKYTFSGYAHAQLKRIKGHEKWITNPKSETPPMLSEFCKFLDNDGNSITNSEEIKKYSQNLFLVHSFGMSMFRVFKSNNDFNPGWFNHDETDFKAIDISDEKLIERKVKFCGWLIVNFDEFKKQRKEWNGYWEWKRNRNIDRAKLEEQFNYDTKHAMHLIRLLNMCKEILTEGTVIVNRPDAAFLLDIRNGKYPYEWIVSYAEEKDKELDEFYNKSTLQYSADYEKIDQLYMNIVMEYWEQKGLLKKHNNDMLLSNSV